MNPDDEDLLEPELRGGTPRRARFTRATQVFRYALLNVGIAVLLFVQWRVTVRTEFYQHLAEGGRIAAATVNRRAEEHGKYTHYYLYFTYRTEDGALQYGSADVTADAYASRPEGSTLELTYLPDCPDRYKLGRIDSYTVQQVRDSGYFGLGVATLIVWFLLLGAESHFRSRLALLRDGVAVVGRVAGREIVEAKGRVYRLKFRYPGPDGRPVHCEATVAKETCDRLGDDAPVTILYPKDDRWSGIPYFQIAEAEIVG